MSQGRPKQTSPTAKAAASLPRVPRGRTLQGLMRHTRWLVIDPEPRIAQAVRDAIGEKGDVSIEHAISITAARRLIRLCGAAGRPIDVAVVDSTLSGATKALLDELRTHCPNAGTIVTSNKPTLQQALDAFRGGALDFIPRPGTTDDLAERLTRAAGHRWLTARTDHRLGRLKTAVRRLNVARRTVGRKVDLLCNDFVHAYDQVAQEMERVRIDRTLRELLASAADLEQLLCHTMDWLLRHLGHCNIAVFLTDDAGDSELGAYMKHTIAGEPAFVQWLQDQVLHEINRRDGKLHAAPEQFAGTLDPLDPQQAAMLDEAVMGASCQYLAESLGTLIVFRNHNQPFTPEHERLLAVTAQAFSEALTALVNRDGNDDNDSVDEADDSADDWWKRGGDAPI